MGDHFFIVDPYDTDLSRQKCANLRRSIGFITGGFALIAAILGFCGIFSHTDALIEMAAKFMAFSLVGGFVFFATHSWLSDGLLAALDRLANRNWLRQLTTWPSDEEDPSD
jgi:hypothetical protein